MSRNLHKSYYKDYFKDKGSYIDFSFLTDKNPKEPKSVKDAIKRNNDNLCSSNLLYIIPENPLVSHKVELTTLYPGLVTGVGISHEAKIEGEFKLGVHFDWTYGMPVIYGSSVKGVLRNYFKDFCNDVIKDRTFETDVLERFENDIFGNDEKKGKWKVADKSIYKRDIFFDAVIVKADKKGRILCSDSITPHGGENHDNPLVNPTPLTFMKIAPGCKIEFRFKLVDSIVKDKEGKKYILTAKEKQDIFQEILTTVGVGAKTNVGYGQLK